MVNTHLNRSGDSSVDQSVVASEQTGVSEAERVGLWPTVRATGLLWAVRVLTAALVLLIWELISRSLDIEFWVSRPSDILLALWDWASSGYIWPHLTATVKETAMGFLLGGVGGVAAGIMLGLAGYAGKALEPFFTALYSIPRIAVTPLFVLWLGIGFLMKAVVAAVVVFFLVFWNTYAGIKQRDQELMDVLRVMGASRSQVLWKAIFPGALPSIYVGFKLGLPYALVGAIVAELVASNEGLGYVLTYSAAQFKTTEVFAALVILMVMGVLLALLLDWSERYVMRWRE